MRHVSVLLAGVMLMACQGQQPESQRSETNKAQSTPEISAEYAAKVHAQTLTLDTHIDIPLNYMTEIDPSQLTDLQVDIPKMSKGQLDAGFWIVYTPQGDLTDAGLEAAQDIAGTRIAAIDQFITENTKHVALAKTVQDVRRITGEGRKAILIGMENAYPIGDAIDTVSYYAEAGVRYMGITHFGHNQFGDSSNLNFVRDKGPKWNGLSPLGKELVREMNEHGIMVDVSHAGKATMMQAADISKTPIIASHSGVKAVADTARNLDESSCVKSVMLAASRKWWRWAHM